jgi:hypothetical protein
MPHDLIGHSTLFAGVAGGGLALATALMPACSSDTDEKSCPVGSESCPCTPGGSCDPGLSCYSDLCVSDTEAAAGAHSAGSPSTPDSEEGGGTHRRDSTGGEGGRSPSTPTAGVENGSPHAAGSGADEGNAGAPQHEDGGAPPRQTGGASHGEDGGAPTEQTGGAPPEESGGTSHEPAGGAPPEETGGTSHEQTGGHDTGGTSALSAGTAGTGPGTGGTEAAGAGGQPEPESPLTCEGDTCCFDDCTGASKCGIADFAGCEDLGERCGGVEAGMCTTIVLPSWWEASGCVATWMEGGYTSGEYTAPAYMAITCPCSTAQGLVAVSPGVQVPAGAECDFSEVAPVSCEEVDTSECL